MSTTTLLELSEDVTSVAPNNEIFLEITPISGKDVIIHSFAGEAAFDANAAVRVVWKYNHATEAEENIWTIKGSAKMAHKKIIDKADVDGVRKIALVLTNTMASGSVLMSGEAVIKQK